MVFCFMCFVVTLVIFNMMNSSPRLVWHNPGVVEVGGVIV